MTAVGACSGPDRGERTLQEEGQLQPGLLATFQDGRASIPLVTPNPNFYLETGESLHPILGTDFQARWVGLISILETGHYRFHGADSLEIGDEPVGAGEVFLPSGLHPFELRFHRQPGTAQLRLQWQSDHFPLEPIPSRVFSHRTEAAHSFHQDKAERGRNLVEDLGCVNCHETESDSLTTRKGPDLSRVGSRLKAPWIYHWLLDPSSVHPGATMPALLDNRSASDVAAYLQSLGAPADGEELPTESDVSRGQELYGLLGCSACHGADSVSLEGVGSKWRFSSLAEYLKNPAKHHPESRMPSMHLSDREAAQLAAHLSRLRRSALEEVVEKGSKTQGRRLLWSSGCLACHQLDEGEDPGSGPTPPAPLGQLSLDAGCLASEPGATHPRYALDDERRAALRAYLERRRSHPENGPAPIHDLRRRLRRLRCLSCHQMDGEGERRNGVPVLTAVGEKLTTRFLRETLSGNTRLRSWLTIRMPTYSPGQVEPLIDAFAKASGINPRASSTGPVTSQKDLTHGLALLGNDAKSGGLGCIGCHDWGDHRAQGERGPQLVGAAQRLRHKWYRRFMLDPIRILPGTAMPTHFADFEPDQLDVTLWDIWAGLGTDPDAPLPRGLDSRPDPWPVEAQPQPSKAALVVREFMPEATPAAIAVGMPEGISYCFDAGTCQLLYAWQGGFLDREEILRKKVGADRKSLTARIVGERFFRSKTFPFQAAPSRERPEVQFLGYRYREGLPEFQYRVGEATIRESIFADEDGLGFCWRFQIQGVGEPFGFAADIEGPVMIRSSAGTIQGSKILIPIDQDICFEIEIEIRENP